MSVIITRATWIDWFGIRSKHMHIAITYVRLKKWWHYFPLTYRAMKITRQMRQEPGFIRMKNTGWGYLHYTMSAWENAEDLKRFARRGAHLDAMKRSSDIASEVGTYTYEGDRLPDWKTARARVLEQANITRFS